MARTIRDWSMAEARPSNWLLANRLAASQAANNVAKTATATPRPESDGPELHPLQSSGGMGAEEPADAPDDDGHAEQDDQGDDHLGVPRLGQVGQGWGDQHAYEQAQPETTEREHLHGGTQAQTVDSRQRDEGQQHIIDPVHGLRSSPRRTLGRRRPSREPRARHLVAPVNPPPPSPACR